MFTIKSFIYLNIISFILAQNIQHLSKNQEEIDPIIEPLELVLRSTDNEGIFYCNSGVEINKQKGKLMATIDNPILVSPSFLLTTEQMNITTIRIRIKPNGYIGINRISCHWSNNLTSGQTADLIIGENPGVIQLKKPCRAYDRRYVQCIFQASTIARAFQNGFPRLYTFSEMTFESSSYRSTPKLVQIINNTELVFHFEPRERNIIPKKTSMAANVTLRRFNSSVYYFNIVPIHTTKVDFKIENITHKQFTIHINHNNTGTISPRLCSGYISQLNNQDTWATVQDITETTDQKILITRLRSSKEYNVCLRCYYDNDDESAKENICNRTQTAIRPLWPIVLGSGATIALLIGITAGLILFFRRRSNTPDRIILQPPTPYTPDRAVFESDALPRNDRYTSEPGEQDEVNSLVDHHIPETPGDHLTDAEKYQHLDDSMNQLIDKTKVSPDTVDLTRQINA